MNIIRFKDVIKPDDKVFNDKYKGKYCWWVNCKWAVAFDDMGSDLYVEASKLNEIPTGVEYLDTEEYSSFVDIMATERINNQINVCQIINDNVGEIPLDNLKRFRTWLAESLIKLAEDVYDNEKDPAAFVEKTNALNLGYWLEYDGTSFYLMYPKCYCDFVNQVEDILPKAWCYCTLGYTKKMFEYVLGKEVEVELIKSVKMGDQECRIKITEK